MKRRYEIKVTGADGEFQVITRFAGSVYDAVEQAEYDYVNHEVTVLCSVDLAPQRALAFPPSERDLNNAWGV